MIGDIIRRFREERGWTQEELASKMGYTSKSTINKIEKNINDVGQRKIVKFAQVFGCDPTDLVAANSIAVPTLPEYNFDESEETTDPSPAKLSLEDEELLEHYHNATPEAKAMVDFALRLHQQKL